MHFERNKNIGVDKAGYVHVLRELVFVAFSCMHIKRNKSRRVDMATCLHVKINRSSENYLLFLTLLGVV